MNMEGVRSMADRGADPRADLDSVRSASPVLHAGLALVLLLASTTLAVYKPRGATGYGQRTQRELRTTPTENS